MHEQARAYCDDYEIVAKKKRRPPVCRYVWMSLMAVAILAGGGAAVLFFMNSKNSSSNNNSRNQGRRNTTIITTTDGPDVNDPDAPWNVVTSDSSVSPSDAAGVFNDPSVTTFFEGDLDEKERKQFQKEIEAYDDEQAMMSYDQSVIEADNQRQIQKESEKGITGPLQEPPRDPTLTYPEFHLPLSCNRDLDDADCTQTSLSMSSFLMNDATEPLIIPCGVCVYLDTTNGEALSYPGGIHIEGKLYSPPEASAVIRTPYIIVFGELKMDEPNDGNEVKISLYGEDQVMLRQPASQPNERACKSSGCNIGSKVIAVAGGKMDISGYPDDCPSWVTLLDTASSTTRVGSANGGVGPNIVANGNADHGVTDPFFGYGNPVGLYCVDGKDDCAHLAFERNNWPRGLFQRISPDHFDGTGQYIVEFDVKMLDEEKLMDAANPQEVSLECRPGEGNVWCPFVRLQTKLNDEWGWNPYYDVNMEYKPNDWSHFRVVFDAKPEWANVQEVNLVLAGGPADSVLMVDNVVFARYTPFETIPGPVDQLVVSPQAAACWNRPGAELVVTSSTRDSAGELVVVVDSVDVASGKITLTEPLTDSPATVANDPEQAVEVALLNRKIVFEAEQDEADPLIGGHLIFYYTRQVHQHLQGVEIRNFGQQSRLGRYPVHFHVCEDSNRSIVRKNVVRQSNQRCYVLHGTQNVILHDNVAYDTAGHCYMLEEGSEVGNDFNHNIGIRTRKVRKLITSSGRVETDDRAGTFWISHASNDFVGNVAAGSEASGIFFETHPKVHGESFYQAPKVDPRTTTLGVFKDNVVHACDFMGFTTYPPGWGPDAMATIENLRVYRNTRLGVFLHNTKNIIIQNSYIANNGYVSVYVLRGDDLTIKDTKIIGLTEGEPVPVGCRNGLEYTGMILHPTKLQEFNVDGVIRGTTLQNVEFLRWSELECKDTTTYPLTIGIDQSPTYLWDAPHFLDEVTIGDDSPIPIDGCKVVDHLGLDDVVIEVNNDKGVLPSGQSGFLVGESALTFTDGSCSPAGGCLYHCEDTCFRTIRYLTSSGAPGNTLVITDANNRRKTVTGKIRERSTRQSAFTAEVFAVALPPGDYIAHFEDASGVKVWPGYVQEVYESPPISCDSYVSFFDVWLQGPEKGPRCEELVRFGSFDDHAYYWQDLNAGISWSPDGGVDNSGALKSSIVARNSMIIQWLDVTCLEEGATYEFSMSFRVVSPDGQNMATCGQGQKCPRATLLLEQLNPETNEYEVIGRRVYVGGLDGSYQTGTAFSQLKGSWTISGEQVHADKVRLGIDQGEGALIIDNVSFQRTGSPSH